MKLQACALCFCLAAAVCSADTVRLDCETKSETASYLMQRLETFFGKQTRLSADYRVTLRCGITSLGPEAYALRVHDHDIEILGGDERGLLYGGFALIEQVRNAGSLAAVQPQTERPHTAFRAIKFNLPWMSYRTGEALQVHGETCRDLAFWERFLDMMAENRFNTLTLWSLHPYAYMVKPTAFPEACPFNDGEMADWQRFWKTLFHMAKMRGIDTYVFNWNIFVSPAFSKARALAEYSQTGSYFGEAERSPLVERYTRQIVTQVINEYDDLTGLGITLGERMGGMTSEERRDWIDRTILEGMRRAKRKVGLFYRAPLSAGTGSGGSTDVSTEQLTRQALETIDFAEPLYAGFKFNWSHGHSATDLFIVHGGPLSDTYWDPMPGNYKVVWTVRNEDFHVLRWGQPDFIRKHVRKNTPKYVGGYIIGSETYIPAKDYITAEGPHKTWDYAFERQWLFYELWGRLLYNPKTPDAVFEASLGRRFGQERGPLLLEAWKRASKFPLHFASFVQGRSDGTLYTEGFSSNANKKAGGLIDVHTLIKHPVLDTAYLNIADFVALEGPPPNSKKTPLDMADEAEIDARAALALAGQIRETGTVNTPLEVELADIEAWGALGCYFAEKLRGATALAQFEKSGSPAKQREAIAHLENAAEHWAILAARIQTYNKPVYPYLFDEQFSWSKHLEAARREIAEAREADKHEAE